MFLVALVLGAGVTLIQSWVIMLAVGILHAQTPGVPALSYWAVVTLVVIVDLLVVIPAGMRSKDA